MCNNNENNNNNGVESIQFLRNKQYYIESLKANTKTEKDVIKLNNYDSDIKKQSDLCKNLIEAGEKKPLVDFFPLYITITISFHGV